MNIINYGLSQGYLICNSYLSRLDLFIQVLQGHDAKAEVVFQTATNHHDDLNGCYEMMMIEMLR